MATQNCCSNANSAIVGRTTHICLVCSCFASRLHGIICLPDEHTEKYSNACEDLVVLKISCSNFKAVDSTRILREQQDDCF